MESLTTRACEMAPTETKEPGRLRRWIRSAIAGATLAISAGGDSAPASPVSPNHPLSTQTTRPHAAHGHNTSITPDQCLRKIAQTLRTPEDIGTFLRQHIRYSREPKGEDHWQTAQETLDKGEGDCEDFAFLAQAILTLQGKTAHVVSPPGHAVCVAIARRPDGKYNSYGFDEHGCNRNGEAHFAPQRGIGKTEPVTPDGYATVLEAINAVLQHYESDDPSASQYKVQPYWIPVLRLRGGVIPSEDIVTVHAFDPDAPFPLRSSGIDLAALTALLGGTYGTYRFLRQRREGQRGTWKEYITTFRLH